MKVYKKEVVIASYREPLDWVSEIPKSWKVTVYNADEQRTTFPDGVTPCKVPNLGREAGQWVHHLYHRYDSIASFTMFLQGDKAHETSAIDDILAADIAPEDSFRYVGGAPDTPFGPPPFLFDHTKLLFKACYGSGPVPPSAPFRVGAQFYVRRSIVHNHPKEFYGSLLKAIRNPNPPWSPAHLLEPVWGCVFNRATH